MNTPPYAYKLVISTRQTMTSFWLSAADDGAAITLGARMIDYYDVEGVDACLARKGSLVHRFRAKSPAAPL